jgi:predicted ABC-type ATPase
VNIVPAEEADRHVIVFGGPNGSGKTSLIDEVRETGLATVSRVYKVPERFINPDQVAKDLVGLFNTQEERDIAAARAAVEQRRVAIEGGEAFAFESVMSHTARIAEMLDLKKRGYQVVLTFITTDDPEKNVARVEQRYNTGTTTGHYVDPNKVRVRYRRTLALLPKAVEVADAAFIYDNSEQFVKASLQAVVDAENGLAITKYAKDWLLHKLIFPLQERQEDRDHLHLQGYDLKDPDELHGAYAGPIIDVTQHFVVHLDFESSQHYLHDRLMLETSYDGDEALNFERGYALSVQYLPRNAPEVLTERLNQA